MQPQENNKQRQPSPNPDPDQSQHQQHPDVNDNDQYIETVTRKHLHEVLSTLHPLLHLHSNLHEPYTQKPAAHSKVLPEHNKDYHLSRIITIINFPTPTNNFTNYPTTFVITIKFD